MEYYKMLFLKLLILITFVFISYLIYKYYYTQENYLDLPINYKLDGKIKSILRKPSELRNINKRVYFKF